MKIAILNDQNCYEKFMRQVAGRLNAEVVVLEWTGDKEKDLAQVKEVNPDAFMVHGHASGHGFNLALAVLTELYIEPIVVSSASRQFPYPIPQFYGEDYDLEPTVNILREGFSNNAQIAWDLLSREREAEQKLAAAQQTLAAAEGYLRRVKDNREHFVEEILKRIKQRKNPPKLLWSMTIKPKEG